MSYVADTIPVKPEPSEKIPGPRQIFRMIKSDLIGVWPRKLYQIESARLKLGRLSLFIANSPETVEYFFVKNNVNYNRKSRFMRQALEPLLGDGLFISEGSVWAARREMEAPAFKSTNLRRFTETMVECAVELRERWKSHGAASPIPMLTEMASLTAEVLCRALFGDELGRHNATRVISGFAEYQSRIKHVDIGTVLGLPDWFPRFPPSRHVLAMCEQIQGVVDQIIATRLGAENSYDSLLDHMLEHHNPSDPNSISLGQIRNEIVVLLMAGHETTANSLAWTWYLLSEHPRVMHRLQSELDRVLDGAPPTMADLSKLTYTRAVYEEALRLYPPVPILSREAIDAEWFGEVRVPKGTLIVVAPWLLHRHEAYWEKPHHFIPERFTGEWSTKNPKYAYIPFSAGPRNCLGAAFGLTEGILCLATLAQSFYPRIDAGHQVDYECRLTLRPSGNLPMLVYPRD